MSYYKIIFGNLLKLIFLMSQNLRMSKSKYLNSNFSKISITILFKLS